MLGNVLGMLATSSAVLGMLCNVLGMLNNVFGRPWRAYNLGISHRRKHPPPHFLPYKLWSKGSSVPPSISVITRDLVIHYSLCFTAYKAESGGVFFRCGTPRLQSMPRSAEDVVKHAEDVAKHAEDVAKHAEDGRGRCKHA